MKSIKEIRRKEVRAIYSRLNEIWIAQRALGYIKLEKPIRHGWYKEIVLTSNVERYKSERYIVELFDAIEKYVWGRSKEETEKVWLNQTSKHLIYRDFPTISRKQFNKLSDRAQKMCTPFQYKFFKKLRTRFYIRIPKGAYRIKYTRAYITHSKLIDPRLESEKAWLHQRLLREGYYEQNERFNRWKRNWDSWEFKKEKLKINRELSQLKKLPTDEIIKENRV